MKDNNYYNKESSVYSEKRYPKKSKYFVHFLFKKRLKILIKILQLITKDKNKLSLLEIGCADGFVSCEIGKNVKGFSEIVGVDISPEMIDVARRNSNIKFLVRDNEISFDKKFNIIIEVGVLNLVDLSYEFNFVKDNLSNDGFYICSIASRTSLYNKLKLSGENDFKHFLTFREYERKISEFFFIESFISYGLFIPYIWKIPFLAQFFQTVTENVFRKIVPNLFHEKIYILRKRQ